MSDVQPTLVVVTGSRWFVNHAPVRAVLRRHEKFELYEGRCPYGGLDDIAKAFAESQGMVVRSFPPDFQKYRAGAAFHIRNKAMVNAAIEEARRRNLMVLLHAFFIRMLPCSGTKATAEYAEKRGMIVERHTFTETEARPRSRHG